SVIGVARNLLAELQQGDTAAFADGAVPPGGAATVDQPLQLGARDDALVSRPPGLIVSIRDGLGVVGFSAANLDEDGAHGVIKASVCPTFKPHDSRWVNDLDYYRNGAERAIVAGEKSELHAQSARLLHDRHGGALVLAFALILGFLPVVLM